MDPTSGLGRCVSLVVYLNEDEARTCVKNQQVGSNRRLKVNKRLITISNKLLLQLVLFLPFLQALIASYFARCSLPPSCR